MPTELEKRMGITEETTPEGQNPPADNPKPDNTPKPPAAGVPADDVKPDTNTTDAGEDEDAKALAVYNKRKGTSFASWDEVDAAAAPAPAPESDEEKKKRREKEKFKYAIENGIITATNYEAFMRDSMRNPRELVFEQFKKERKEAGDSDATIEIKFTRLYGEDLVEDEDDTDKVSSFVKERRLNDLKREAARIIKKTYPEITSLDSKYEAFEAEQKTQEQKKKETEKLAVRYRQDVESIFSGLKSRKISFTNNDEPFETEFTYKPEILNQIKAEFLKPETFNTFTANYSKETIQAAIALQLQAATEDDRTAFVAKAYHAKQLEKRKTVRNALAEETITGKPNERRPAGRLEQMHGIVEN